MIIRAWALILLCSICINSYAKLSSIEPYGGIGIGQAYGAWNLEQSQIFVDEINHYQGLRGWQWQNFIGARVALKHHIEAGIEFGGGYSNTKSRKQQTVLGPYNETWSIKSNLSLALIPGFNINQQFIYGRFGEQWSQLSFFTNSTRNPINTLSFTEWEPGILAGTGIEAPLGSYVSMRSEYDYTRYNNRSSTVDGTSGPDMIIKPRQESYWLSIVFHPHHDTPHISTTTLKQGWQLGAGVGRDNVFFHALQSSNPSILIINTQNTFIGYNAQTWLGYSFNLFHYLRSTLLTSASYSSARYQMTALSTPTVDHRLKLHDAYMLRDNLGYLTSPSNEFYVTLGGALGHFQKTASAAAVAAMSGNFDTYRWGFLMGIGDEIALTKHLSYVLEGTYTRFASIHPAPGNPGEILIFHPNLRRVTANLIYNF